MAKDAKTVREELARPFAPEDLEWRIQVTSKDKTSGLAIPYVTNRAIQDRLDEVVGPENWYNDYKPWHGNGKKDAQICGISIYFEGKGFITKWDGAEDSDIEPIKGGLSDSMKRAAVQWGIGRVLYKMTKPLWVSVEQKGNSCVIRDSERPKLNAAYLELLDKLHQLPTSPGAAQAQLSYKRDGQAGQQAQNAAPTAMPQKQQAPQQPSQQPQNAASAAMPQTQHQGPQQSPQPTQPSQQPLPFMTRQVCQYVVLSVSNQQDMSGQPLVCAVLQNAEGKQAKVYAQGSHPMLMPGTQLYDAQITMRKQGNVAFYTLDGYQVVQQAA